MAKITHIFKTYFPETNGGLEEAIRQYGSHAAKNGFDVEVVSVGPKTYTVNAPDGIKTKFYKKTFDVFSNPFSFVFARSFKKIVEDTDILHFHFPWPTAELLVLFYNIKKPALVTFHCDIHKIKPLKRLYLPFVKQYLKKIDKICISSKVLLKTTPYLAQFRDKIEEVSYFINEKRFSNLPDPDPEIIEFTQKIKNYALFVGVLRWYKGLDILLDAAKKIEDDIVIVGKGDLYDRLYSRIKNENLKNVHLLGFQNDNNLKFLIEKSGLIVLPSIAPAEAFGQILLEGLYFSKPLVSTELGTGTSLVNRHNYTGFVVKPGSGVSLAGAMNKLLTDDVCSKKFSKNAYHHYLDNFTATAQGDKYIRIYRSFLQ
ncbi:glycosyltransferase [Desulfobacula toluolica]|uniref:WbpZ: glycosyl transferase, family I n=1 Tax=Desulfobacula toluolica (strain DSM 7467 / Tol2) TaxID=651182 RepID=K0NLQ0_DESTT|nr:glycosyltransferase [Desulfobacula toluolica]CCK79567.1 WbpZ: glycosyl transferase, family I [Desulfobacula toluolica Tol2]